MWSCDIASNNGHLVPLGMFVIFYKQRINLNSIISVVVKSPVKKYKVCKREFQIREGFIMVFDIIVAYAK